MEMGRHVSGLSRKLRSHLHPKLCPLTLLGYTQNRNNSNEPGRPITITFFNSTNLYVDNLNITQPQFWATFVSHSHNVTMDNVYVNATSHDEWGTVNTDGCDTWNSRDIFMTNWTVTNGDDCIAAKGNTTNLIVRNATCYGGAGMTIGSVGQYPDTPDYDENILFEDVILVNAQQAAYIKTWQGLVIATSVNGDAGGGGSGLVRNITFRNFKNINVALPIMITQCIYTEGSGADTCETSKMQIEDVTFANFTGTSRYNIAASLHCAASHPCPDIYLQDVNITSVNQTLGLPLFNTTLQHEVYQVKIVVALFSGNGSLIFRRSVQTSSTRTRRVGCRAIAGHRTIMGSGRTRTCSRKDLISTGVRCTLTYRLTSMPACTSSSLGFVTSAAIQQSVNFGGQYMYVLIDDCFSPRISCITLMLLCQKTIRCERYTCQR